MDAYQEYRSQVMASEGFDVNDFIPLFDGQITPLDNSKHSRNLVCAYVELALSDYKLLQAMTSGEIHMEFLEVYKANVQANPADMVRMPFKAKHANFYITFLVKNKKMVQFRLYKLWFEDVLIKWQFECPNKVCEVEAHL